MIRGELGKAIPKISVPPIVLQTRGIIGSALAVAGLLIVPLFANNYHLHSMIMALIFLMPALGLNLILGYTGLLSLAQGMFFGIGAYTSALLAIHFGWPFWLTCLSAGVVCALIAVPVAIPSLRLRRYSFVMVTLAFVVIGQSVSKNWVSLTRGDMGLSGVPRPELSLWGSGFTVREIPHFYYLFLAVAILAALLFYALISSPAGRCMRAIREDETLAESHGVNAWTYKLIVFALSAFFAGIGGGMYVHYLTVISPLVFELFYTLTILIIVFGGGAGTFGGVLLGSFLFVGLMEVLRIATELRLIIFGLLLLALVFYFPGGLGPLLARFARWFAATRLEETVSRDNEQSNNSGSR